MTTEAISPNFIIVRAHKAGANLIYASLKHHPQVFMPERFSEQQEVNVNNLMTLISMLRKPVP
jgi:lambda repressor-like predicted transcriptional regulator